MSTRRGVIVAALLSTVIAPLAADTIDAGVRLHVRLKQSLSSYASTADTRIAVDVIAPLAANGRVLIPLGAEILGHVESAKRVGLGLSRERAGLELAFDTLRLPDGQQHAMRASVDGLDNAREAVDEHGVITGIRATASFASTLSGFAVSLGLLDPMLLGFTMTSSLSAFRIPESEIILPAGTELTIRLLDELALSHDFGPIAPPLTGTDAARAELAGLVRSLPFRTVTDVTNLPSDMTNLVLLGSRESIAAAMEAGGWGTSDLPGGRANYAALRAIVENQGYREAPMSILRLDGAAPSLTYSKTLNTFFERHHVRVFGPLATYGGMPVWTASSTHDSGIAFATRVRSFIHIIDGNIDEERDKIVYDLILTGCADAIDYVDRPWLPAEATNATGDRLLTDRRVAVLRMNECRTPRRADDEAAAPAPVRPKPSASARLMRNVTLTVKNDAFRGNLFYQGYSGLRMAFRSRKRSPAAATRRFTVGGEVFHVVPGAEQDDHDETPSELRETPVTFDPVDRPRTGYAGALEISFSGGPSGYGSDTLSTQNIEVRLPLGSLGSIDDLLTGDTRLEHGWSIAPAITFNQGARLSHEFGYAYNRTTFQATLTNPILEPAVIEAPAVVAQFNYNLIANLQRNGSRIRPYAAIGPALQTIRLTDGTRGSNRLLRLTFKEARFLAEAYRFGSTPPLEGGGIFQFALQYGAGVKVHLTPRVLVRLDFRETVSESPDFWTKSHDALRGVEPGDGLTIEPQPLISHGPLRQHRLSTGLGVSF